MRKVYTVLLAVACVGVASACGAGEKQVRYEDSWPQWRGPQATGVAPRGNPPLEWDERRNVRWKVAVPGKGLSTPIVWGRHVFLTTAIAADEEVPTERPAGESPDSRPRGIPPARVLDFVVLALERDSGAEVWRRTVRRARPHEGTHTDGSWASGSPVTDGEYLIAHFGSYGTYGLDLAGNVKWERDLGDMTTRRGFGEGSSPVIHGDRVVINWDHEGPSFLVVLDRATGKTLWQAERDEVTSWSTPIVVEHGDRSPQVVVSATGRTRGYDLKTGKVLWEAAGMTVNTIPSPVHAAGRVYVTSGFRGNALQAIDLAAARGEVNGPPALVWTYDRDTPYVPSPLLYGERLYLLKHNTGILSVFDARSGSKHFGPERLDGVEGVYASPVGAAGRVYIAGRDGTTLVLRDGPALELLARNELDDTFDASPAIAGTELYLRGRRHLYCLAEPTP